MAATFFWDCTGISNCGSACFHVSHDEFGRFASSDALRVARFRREFDQRFVAASET